MTITIVLHTWHVVALEIGMAAFILTSIASSVLEIMRMRQSKKARSDG